MNLKRIWLYLPLFSLFISAIHIFTSLYSTRPNLNDGKLDSLSDEVSVEYDSFGVPTIKASRILDAVRAQGYVVAKDRLYQMDLMRRKMEGRLSEVFGKRALEVDKISRFFNFRKVADEAFSKMDLENKKVLIAYAEGVNAWMKDHPSFEMKLLHYSPKAWSPADTFLIVLSMFQTLDRWESEDEVTFNLLNKKYPKNVVDFLTRDYGFKDAVPGEEPRTPEIIPPDSKSINLHQLKKSSKLDFDIADAVSIGSNAWVIPKNLTKNGKPVLSGDPHLQVTMPNLWYRVHIVSEDYEITGASIPGIPLIVIGTNGLVAWTFTNADSDTVDLVELKNEQLKERSEIINSRFSGNITYHVKDSDWGPVLESEGTKYAVQWAALDSKNLSLLDLKSINMSHSVKESLKNLENWAGPVQNCFLADMHGNSAWTVVGKVPNRVGFDGITSAPRDSTHFWNGYYKPMEMLKIINPENLVLSSGNQRTTPYGKNLYKVAHAWSSPARGYRLKEIFTKPGKKWDASESALQQLDTYSVLHDWYKTQLLKSISNNPHDPWIIEIKTILEKWDGRISADSAAYPLMKKYRLRLLSELLKHILEPFGEKEKEAMGEFFSRRDEWITSLLTKRPENWLPAQYKSYDDFQIKVIESVAKELAKSPSEIKKLRWGNLNKSTYRHSLSRLFPFLSFLIDLPERDLNGDSLVLRVEYPKHSASMRMTIDMSKPKEALFTQPGGQSGHPLSKNYKDQFDYWYFGRFTSLYPGPTVSSFKLRP